ncbi:transglycosylase SLT domain-containing protein [Thermithiobacillus tepidarius DSM 3134]|uniref:transglycosylase SLT domain-containing protein n=1 Tax=Thermithiobacillus tepidarius TaxID=929 RepID=UPI00048B7D0F|nr:transglycosylase SLT domain-containing protein [Thermithiobacillus tepidarius]
MNKKPLLFASLATSMLICSAGITTAHADIYTYTDADGVLHISNVRQNKLYKLYMRSAVSRPQNPAAGAAPARGYGTPNAARRAQFEQMIEDAARTYMVDKALVHAVITAESGYNPNAVSRKGATGLMQLMPATARRYGATNLFDPWENIQAGTRYLKDLLRMFNNDTRLAVAAYNAGENAVVRYGYAVPPYAETASYVPKVLHFYERYRSSM